jgi:hypothetical protein
LQSIQICNFGPAKNHSQGKNSNIKQSRNQAPMKNATVPEEYRKIIEKGTALYKVG